VNRFALNFSSNASCTFMISSSLCPYAMAFRHPMKTKWSREEDELLRAAVAAIGPHSWSRISAVVRTRTGKQCRERWVGQLAPSVSKENWMPHEDAILVLHHGAAGNRWTAIASQLPGRSPLQVKNRWNWLTRHCGTICWAGNSECEPEVFGKRRCQTIFEPLFFDNGVFGTAFEEFQASMLLK
jgi:hypothetical protein